MHHPTPRPNKTIQIGNLHNLKFPGTCIHRTCLFLCATIPSYSDNVKFSSYIQANTVFKMHSRPIWQLKLKSQWWQAATHYTLCLKTVVNPGICSAWDERSIISIAKWNTGNLRHMYLVWDICSKWDERIRHGQVEWRKAAIEMAHFLLQYISNSSKTIQ